MVAAWHDYSRICRILTNAGADLNIRNKVTGRNATFQFENFVQN